MEFAKLFTLKNKCQVLYTKNEIEDDEADTPYAMVIRCDVKGISLKVTLGFKTKKEMNSAFRSATIKSAESTYENFVKELS